MRIKSLAIIAVLVIAILGVACLPVGRVFTAQAQTDNSALIAQLQAQIQSLMQQVAQLRAQQDGPDLCHTFDVNLGYASSGSPEVGYLHAALVKEGISYMADTENIYGKPTMSAVIRFQQKYLITPASGYVGPITRAKLNALYGCAISVASPTPIPTPTPAANPVPTLTPVPTATPEECPEIVAIVQHIGPGPTLPPEKEDFLYYWLDNTDKTCRTKKKFCRADMYYIGLQTFENQSQCLSAASDIASSGCTPNWQCGWTACVKNGYQYPLAVDSNNCGLKQKGFIICADGALSRKCDYTAQPRLTLTSPNGGEQWALGSPHNITWQQVGVGGPGIKIVLKNTETGTSYLIHDAATYGSYSWTVGDSRESTSLQVPLGNYKIEISSAYSPTGQSQPLSDSSDNYFSIVAPSTQLPLVCSGVVTIDATGQNLVLYDSTPYDIKTDSCRGYRCFVNNKISLACWDKVPNDLWHEDATKCKFYCGVDCVYIPALKEDTCRGRTLPPSIAITSPNGGEQWAQGSDQRITWNVYGFDSISNNPQVEVWIIGTDGTTGRYELPTIQDNVLDGMLFWTIKSGPGPQFSQWVLPPPGKYKVELIAGGYKDYSDNYFTITAP